MALESALNKKYAGSVTHVLDWRALVRRLGATTAEIPVNSLPLILSEAVVKVDPTKDLLTPTRPLGT